MAFISAFWQHLASSATLSMIQIMTAGAVAGSTGLLAVGLGWGVVFLNVIVLVMCIRLLQNPEFHSF